MAAGRTENKYKRIFRANENASRLVCGDDWDNSINLLKNYHIAHLQWVNLWYVNYASKKLLKEKLRIEIRIFLAMHWGGEFDPLFGN